MKYSLPLNNFSRSLLDNLTSFVFIAIGRVSRPLTCMSTKTIRNLDLMSQNLEKFTIEDHRERVKIIRKD